MPTKPCNPECRNCGRTIDIENEESIKVDAVFIHLECEEEYNNYIDYLEELSTY